MNDTQSNKEILFLAMKIEDNLYAGVAIALSVVHGGPGPQFISPSLFKTLTTSPYAIVIHTKDDMVL